MKTRPHPINGRIKNRVHKIPIVVLGCNPLPCIPEIRLPPRIKFMHGIVASPKMAKQSVKKCNGACEPINILFNGTHPPTISAKNNRLQ